MSCSTQVLSRQTIGVHRGLRTANREVGEIPSKVNAGYRVLTSGPTVTSVDITEGDPSELAHCTELDATHAAVLQELLSTRLLGVLSL